MVFENIVFVFDCHQNRKCPETVKPRGGNSSTWITNNPCCTDCHPEIWNPPSVSPCPREVNRQTLKKHVVICNSHLLLDWCVMRKQQFTLSIYKIKDEMQKYYLYIKLLSNRLKYCSFTYLFVPVHSFSYFPIKYFSWSIWIKFDTKCYHCRICNIRKIVIIIHIDHRILQHLLLGRIFG